MRNNGLRVGRHFQANALDLLNRPHFSLPADSVNGGNFDIIIRIADSTKRCIMGFQLKIYF
jgi:hypothetical protein